MKLLGNSRLLLALAGVAALIVGLVFYFFDPAVYHFYPRCVLYQATGLLCPACGGLRATHQLLHGNVGAAFHLNPLVVLLTPVAAWLAIAWTVKKTLGWNWPVPRLHQPWPWVVVVVVVLVVFGVARNII